MLKTNTCTNNNKHSKSNRQTAMESRTTTMAKMAIITKPPTTTTRTTTTTTTHRKNRNMRDMQWNRIGRMGISFGGKMSLWLILLLTAHAIHAADDDATQQRRNGHITTTTTAAEAEAEAEPPISSDTNKYSQPLTTNIDDDSFRPIIPKDYNPEYISRHVFTETGQYRVFAPVDSDLRHAVNVAMGQHKGHTDIDTVVAAAPKAKPAVGNLRATTIKKPTTQPETKQTPAVKMKLMAKQMGDTSNTAYVSARDTAALAAREYIEDEVGLNEIVHMSPETGAVVAVTASSPSDAMNSDLQGLESLLVEYVQNFFEAGQYEPLPELLQMLQRNHSSNSSSKHHKHHVVVADDSVRRFVREAVDEGSINVSIPRALETGRLFFFGGLKKLVWPIMMGLNVLKSLLFAMFLPAIIGTFSKLIGKGITSGSAPLFIRPMDTPQDLDFKDNNFDEDNKFTLNEEASKDGSYAYNQPEASQTQQQYAYNAPGINHQALSRYGGQQQQMQDSYLSALQSIGSASFKNSNSISGSSSGGGFGGGGGYEAPARQKPAAPANMNTFQTFQKVPASSLLLSNYDPFYSPLLSRLDSVFAQLKLNSESEVCREKLICLMYANPAKYAPYSNLVSAQLSRELNELRKPTSDNPDILRFFKYMRAAKDGQDGVDCEQTFDGCKEFKDFENPAMVSTYHDINKLVQARKLT